MKVKILFILIALSIRGFAQQDSVFIENSKYLLIFYNDESFKSNDTTPGLRACLVNERDGSGYYRKIADTMYHENGSIFRITTFIDGDNLKTIEFYSRNFDFRANDLKGNKQSFIYKLGCIELAFGFSDNKVQRGWIKNKSTNKIFADFVGINELQKVEQNYIFHNADINITFDEHFKDVDIKIDKFFLLKQCTNMTITQPILKYLK